MGRLDIDDKDGWLLDTASDDRASRVLMPADAKLEVPTPAEVAMLKPVVDVSAGSTGCPMDACMCTELAAFETSDSGVESKRRVG